MTAEAKLDWDDDLAVLYVEFGWGVLDESMRWHRQNSDRRPTIPGIKEQCRVLREKQGKRASSEDVEWHEYERAKNAHLADPSNREFLPVAYIIRDTLAFLALKAECKAKGYTPTVSEMDAWRAQRDRETEDEWAADRAAGVRQVVMRSTIAEDAGARGGAMKRIGR